MFAGMRYHSTVPARVAAILVMLMMTAIWSQEVTSADFDANGRVDLDDLALLRQAVGGTDMRFDLDQSGRVDVGDLFRFADFIDEPLPFESPPEPLHYTVRNTRQQVILSMPEYSARIQHGTPFGIFSLRLRGQRTDFANKDLPLADWEWLWYRSPVTGRRRHKLMEMNWGAPELLRFPDRLEVVYRFPISRDGVVAKVHFRFLTQGSTFHVIYSVYNGSQRALSELYFMLGLPGFTNHGHVTAVASARQVRLPRWPHKEFLAEAKARNQSDYLLLRHDARAGHNEGLKGSVRLQDGDDEYQLSSYYLTDLAIDRAYSAHTNKPRYLTSHLYVTLGDLAPQQQRSVTIHHVITGP
ncbi:MAG TPA: hypothetical protein DIC52_19720 [Candidatus Latescibacteria bacterium]|nr:hypothetical protein [Candidatus Latescibacterota bacterium]